MRRAGLIIAIALVAAGAAVVVSLVLSDENAYPNSYIGPSSRYIAEHGI